MTWIWWVAIPAAIIVVCVIGQLTGLMDFSMKGKDGMRSAGNIMGPIDGLFAPNRQEAMQEQERQTELPAQAPAPGDPLLDLENGIAMIDLDQLHTPTPRFPYERESRSLGRASRPRISTDTKDPH